MSECHLLTLGSILFVICMSDSILLGWDLTRTGDVADDRFFHKTNDSDAAQFYILYPAIPTHGMSFQIVVKIHLTA